MPAAAPNRLRIIGGRWRGRRISFPALPQLRPSPDRVRETLFNWLQPHIADAHCLDLFAGSGALGLEALSRGAGRAVFVDSDPRVVRHLQTTLQQLQAQAARVIDADAMQFLRTSQPERFDIVFLDPPYASALLGEVCHLLTCGWLAADALIYLDCAADTPLPQLPVQWRVHRAKRAGQVGYHLLQATSGTQL